MKMSKCTKSLAGNAHFELLVSSFGSGDSGLQSYSAWLQVFSKEFILTPNSWKRPVVPGNQFTVSLYPTLSIHSGHLERLIPCGWSLGGPLTV